MSVNFKIPFSRFPLVRHNGVWIFQQFLSDKYIFQLIFNSAIQKGRLGKWSWFGPERGSVGWLTQRTDCFDC
jgi:hypothetical protein